MKLPSIHLITHSKRTKGYKDFKSIAAGPIGSTISCHFLQSTNNEAILQILTSLKVSNGDIVCIVRGGGDVYGSSFRPYHDFDTANHIKSMGEHGITVITGIGHEGDEFIIEKFAKHRCITPTDAAYRLLSLFTGSHFNFSFQGMFELTGDHPEYTFDNYLAQPDNFHKSACLSFVEKDGFIPLLTISGSASRGKTHLLRAIQNQLKYIQPELKIKFYNSVDFVSDVTKSFRNKTLDLFDLHIKELDVLLIDDAAFFKGKIGTQKRLIKIIDYFQDNAKILAVTLNEDFDGFLPDLSVKLKNSLIADIPPLDDELFRQALRQYSTQIDDSAPDDVIIEFIAQNSYGDFAAARSALKNIYLKAGIMGQTITLDFAKSHLKNHFVKNYVSHEKVLTKVSEFYGVPFDQLVSKSRRKNIVAARQIAMFILKSLRPDLSYHSIGHVFGGKDHTTVLHAFNKISLAVKCDSRLNQEIEKIKHMVS